MKETLQNLLKVKTLVTLLITLVFCYLAVVGKISSEQVMTIFGVVIAFYFGTQSEKKHEEVKYTTEAYGGSIEDKANLPVE